MYTCTHIYIHIYIYIHLRGVDHCVAVGRPGRAEERERSLSIGASRVRGPGEVSSDHHPRPALARLAVHRNHRLVPRGGAPLARVGLRRLATRVGRIRVRSRRRLHRLHLRPGAVRRAVHGRRGDAAWAPLLAPLLVRRLRVGPRAGGGRAAAPALGRRTGRARQDEVGGLAKGENLLERRRVVVLGGEAQHAARAREVGVAVVALVAQIHHRVATTLVVALEKGAHLAQRVAVERLEQARSGKPERDQLRKHIRQVQIEAIALEPLFRARDELAQATQRRRGCGGQGREPGVGRDFLAGRHFGGLEPRYRSG